MVRAWCGASARLRREHVRPWLCHMGSDGVTSPCYRRQGRGLATASHDGTTGQARDGPLPAEPRATDARRWMTAESMARMLRWESKAVSPLRCLATSMSRESKTDANYDSAPTVSANGQLTGTSYSFRNAQITPRLQVSCSGTLNTCTRVADPDIPSVGGS